MKICVERHFAALAESRLQASVLLFLIGVCVCVRACVYGLSVYVWLSVDCTVGLLYWRINVLIYINRQCWYLKKVKKVQVQVTSKK